MGKYVKHIKIAKNLRKDSLTATIVYLKLPEIYFDIYNWKKSWKSDHKHQRYGEKSEKYKNSLKPAKGSWTVIVVSCNRREI